MFVFTNDCFYKYLIMRFLNKKCVALSVALGVALMVLSCGPGRVAGTQVLFTSAATDTVPYRIPALAVLPDGGLVALSDYRHCKADIGYGRVDIHGRVSGNGGRSWGDEFVVVEGSGVPGSRDCGFGDAAVVADRESGEVLAMMVCGHTVYWHETTNRQNPNKMAVLRSHDGGQTWTPWTEITESVYTLFDDCRSGCMQSCFVGSGKILQSRQVKVGSHYRIYAALCARPNGNRVIYSDDFGHTWRALGGPDAMPALYGDEPKCEELPDGSIVLSSRTRGGRIFNIFRYTDVASGSGEWGAAAFSGAENNGCTAVDNACNGEILIVPAVRKSDRKEVKLVLQSVPLGPDRTNVGIYYKEIPADVSDLTPSEFAADWQPPYQVSYRPSSYSTMIQLKNGNIGFFYEEYDNCCPGGFNMTYRELTLETLTSGRYK